MNAEEQIQKLKQIPPMSKEEKKRKLVTSIILSISTLISVLFLVYAFMQKLEADKQAAIAVAARMEADAQRAEAERQRAVAIHNEMRAMAAQQEADRQRVLAMEALAACEKSKRK